MRDILLGCEDTEDRSVDAAWYDAVMSVVD